MAQYNKTNFKALYGSTGATFPDNTIGAISEGDIRQFGEDIADSFFNVPTSIVSSVLTTGGTITLNFSDSVDRTFVGATSFAAPKTIALSNATNAVRLEFQFNITNIAAVLTFPSTFKMADVRWDSSGKTWTPFDTGVFKGSAFFDGTNWLLEISQAPYV